MRRRRRRPDHRQPAAAAELRPGRQGQGAAADRRRAGRRASFRRSATSTSPSTSPSLPASDGTSSWSRRPAASRSCATASACPSRSWTSATRSRRGASRACCRWPSRPTTGGRGSLYVDYTDTAGDTRVVEYRRSSSDPLVADPRERSRGPARGPAVREPQRRPPAVRPGEAPGQPGPRPAVHRARRRRLGGRPGAQRPGPLDPARQDPAHRPARLGRAPLLGPGLQPVRRTLGRPAGDLLLRPPQSVALLVRPPDRRPVDRRRGAELVRGGRRRRAGRGLGRQLRLVRIRGLRALQRGPAGARRTCPRCSPTRSTPSCAVTGGYVVRDREPALRSTAATSTATSAPGELRSFAAAPGRRATDDRALGPPGPVAELVRRGQRRPPLRDLARGTRLPAGRRRGPESSCQADAWPDVDSASPCAMRLVPAAQRY